jgi:predicted MFS family arabinose efflux permease
VEAIGHQVYPLPEGLDMKNIEAVKAYVAALPTGALLFVLLAYGLGSFAGGWLAAKIARTSQIHLPLTVGGIQLLFGIMNIVMIPHPTWFAIAAVIVFLPAAYLGGKLGSPAR